MGKAITCKTCGKRWENGEEYMKDNEKCGKEECPNRKLSIERNSIQRPFQKTKPPKAPIVHTKTGNVISFYDPSKPVYTMLVPKVIVTTIFPVRGRG